MAKPSRMKGSGGSEMDNPARSQDVQGEHRDKAFYVTKGGIMTPVAAHAQGTIKPGPLNDRGYNKEPGQDTLPTAGGPASGGLGALSAFGLKGK